MSTLYHFAFTMQPAASTETMVVMNQGDQPILAETRKEESDSLSQFTNRLRRVDKALSKGTTKVKDKQFPKRPKIQSPTRLRTQKFRVQPDYAQKKQSSLF